MIYLHYKDTKTFGHSFSFLLIFKTLRASYLQVGNFSKIKEETKNSLYGDILIWPQVLNYDYDDKYIIVYQVYDGSEFYDVSSKQDKKEKDSLLNQFSKLEEMKNCYWIIDKETNLVMGPMTKSDFDRKCKELHVKAKMRRFHEKEFWDQSGTLKGIKAGL